MRRTFVVFVFVLATFTWALAQNPGAIPQKPDASQSHPSAPGSASQDPSAGAQAPSQSQAASGPITEGCLGGSEGNYTITDKAGTSYKLNFPANSNVSVLSAHLGESVAVMGDIKDAGKAGQTTINVAKIGKGTGTCPAAGSSAAPQTSPTPKK